MTKNKINRGLIEFLHFRRRLKERYNIEITKQEYRTALKTFKPDPVKSFAEQEYINTRKGTTIIRGRVVKVVYNPQTGSFVSALY